MIDPLGTLGLTAEFETKLQALLDACCVRNVRMHPYFGIRDPVEQARLWRQSRSADAIAQAKNMLLNDGAPFLAKCLDAAGITRGHFATNALPGLSWHQYGIACDCAWIVDGAEEWSSTAGGVNNGYKVYAEEAAKLGLRTLGSMGDWGHVQEPPANSPEDSHTLAEINTIMQQKWGDLIK